MDNVHAKLPGGDIYHAFGLYFYVLPVYDGHNRHYADTQARLSLHCS